MHRSNGTRMKVTLLQYDIRLSSPKDNIRQVREMLLQADRSDLYVLPELWNTGFGVDPRSIDDDTTKQSLLFMQEMAAQLDGVLCGSMSVSIEKDFQGKPLRYANRFYFVRPDGSFDVYDKCHLFGYGGENKWYSAGNKRVIVEWRGWKWLPLVCYDLRFPCWIRYRGDYDGIIVVANWAHKRIAAWDVLTCARAIENQSYVVACNRVGTDQHDEYAGHSVVISPHGDVIGSFDDDKEGVLTAELSLDELTRERQQYRFLNDRDNQ